MTSPEFPLIADRARVWLVGLAFALSSMIEPGAVSSMSMAIHSSLATGIDSGSTWSNATESASPVEVDPLLATVWLRDALREVETAGRVLGALRSDTSQEAVIYLSELECALGEKPSELSLSSLPTLTAQLRAARERFESTATTWERWSRVAHAVQQRPNEWLTTPERFVIREECAVTLEPFGRSDESDFRVQRMVDAFWG